MSFVANVLEAPSAFAHSELFFIYVFFFRKFNLALYKSSKKLMRKCIIQSMESDSNLPANSTQKPYKPNRTLTYPEIRTWNLARDLKFENTEKLFFRIFFRCDTDTRFDEVSKNLAAVCSFATLSIELSVAIAL